jgi:copper homeostasis protein CutC
MGETKRPTLTPEEKESLRQYVRELAKTVMDAMREKMELDMDHVDPTLGAHAAGLAAMFCLHMATDSKKDREDFIRDMVDGLKLLATTDDLTSDDGDDLIEKLVSLRSPSSRVH